MFLSMSKKEMASKGAMLIENVEVGLRQYHTVILKGDKHSMDCFLKRCLEENEEDAFADFHYAMLTPRQQEAFMAGLSNAEKEVFSQFETGDKQVYYPLTKENVTFLSGITARGLLFSTFFFTGHRAAVWGNFELEYPIFCEETDVLEFYKNIAIKCGLELV